MTFWLSPSKEGKQITDGEGGRWEDKCAFYAVLAKEAIATLSTRHVDQMAVQHVAAGKAQFGAQSLCF